VLGSECKDRGGGEQAALNKKGHLRNVSLECRPGMAGEVKVKTIHNITTIVIGIREIEP